MSELCVVRFDKNTWPSCCETEDGCDVTGRTYFHLGSPSIVKVSLKLSLTSLGDRPECTLALYCADHEEIVNVEPITEQPERIIDIGEFDLKEGGYHFIELHQHLINVQLDIQEMHLQSEEELNWVRDSFHFGRRGPSCHWFYSVPKELKGPVEYFYNEVTVPEGNDVIGSYFMACGWSYGYFGMQVNSEGERRILFSVWNNDQDSSIDHSGTGGQSFRQFMWKTDVTYKFLLKGAPCEEPDVTEFSAYFCAPELNDGDWLLHAVFRRPHMNKHLTGLYSFLENFREHTGHLVRQAHYGNQWVRDTHGNWAQVLKARLSCDNTAKKNARHDYEGGLADEGRRFYLKNCGFFNRTANAGDTFERLPNEHDTPPVDIDDISQL